MVCRCFSSVELTLRSSLDQVLDIKDGAPGAEHLPISSSTNNATEEFFSSFLGESTEKTSVAAPVLLVQDAQEQEQEQQEEQEEQEEQEQTFANWNSWGDANKTSANVKKNWEMRRTPLFSRSTFRAIFQSKKRKVRSSNRPIRCSANGKANRRRLSPNRRRSPKVRPVKVPNRFNQLPVFPRPNRRSSAKRSKTRRPTNFPRRNVP